MHVSAVSGLWFFKSAWKYTDLIRSVQDLEGKERRLVPASPVTVTTGKPGSFRQQQTNQPHQRMTKRVDCVQNFIELYRGRNVFTLWMIWTAVLPCNRISCHWSDRFPERPQRHEWMTVCFMIPFVYSILYFCLQYFVLPCRYMG